MVFSNHSNSPKVTSKLAADAAFPRDAALAAEVSMTLKLYIGRGRLETWHLMRLLAKPPSSKCSVQNAQIYEGNQQY